MRLSPRRLGALLFLCLWFPAPLWAGSYSTTIPSQALTADDAYLNEETPTEKNGGKPELRLRANGASKNRNVVVDIPLPSLAGATILQAWLKLTEFGANSATPIDARIYPLTEAWTEPDVSWRDRTAGQAWGTPGGTRGPYWSGRALASSATNGGQVSWQVGPILSAWQMGDLDNYGFLITGDPVGADREVIFRSSEFTTVPTATPQLLIYYTDEPPAIRNGWAEIQPSAARAGATNMPFSLWLDVDASSVTPTGDATGFDILTLAHGGALAVTGVDALDVGGTPVPKSQVTWYDNGTTLTVRFPVINVQDQVRLDFRADVLSPATTYDIELPVHVDDTSTPGAWPQVLWPGHADDFQGNGDSWNLAITAGTAVRIDLVPDSARVVSRMCTQFQLFGGDGLGNRFAIDADSFAVLPPSRGTIGKDGLFCGAQPGVAAVVAHSRFLTDTSWVTVTPALTPSITQIELRDPLGSAATSLTPLDAMLLDVTLSDGDGFMDVTAMDFVLHYEGHRDDADAPAFRAAFRWQRAADPAWTLLDPALSTWTVLPGLCAVDTATNSTAPQTVRLAFVVGRIARATAAGLWNADVEVLSSTPPDTTLASRSGLNAEALLEVTVREAAGAFSSGRPGATRLPLRDPVSGNLTLEVMANATYDLRAEVMDMVGVSSPSDTLHVGSPTHRISWAFNSSGSGGGTLDTSFTTIAAAQAPLTSETPLAKDLYLWIDHPPSIPPQDYAGGVRLRLTSADPSADSPRPTVPLTATVVGAGQAASAASGEVLPNAVQVGVVTQPFSAYLLPVFQAGDTGIDRVLVNIPAGYGVPAVTSVRVAGLPVSFSDLSQAGLAEAVLSLPVVVSELIEVRFQADTPIAVDSAGANFVIQYDDAGTSLPPQAATEGDANGLADGNDWRVLVTPGPVARLEVWPDAVACYLDSTVAFTASAYDAYGNLVNPVLTWSTEGGIGAIGASTGIFIAQGVGTGRVIAQSGGVADTAWVTVKPARGIQARAVQGPGSVFQGETAASFRVKLENLGADPVSLDTVEVVFSRVSRGDAGGDFVATPDPGNASSVAGGDTTWVAFAVGVDPDAATGFLVVDARAVATETASGLRLTDESADATLTLNVVPGGIDLSAFQVPTSVRPGTPASNLFTLTLRNLYPEARTLRSVTFTSRTTGPGNRDQLDAELGDLTLYVDDGSGMLEPDQDAPLLQTVALGGIVNFAPLSFTLPARGEARLLVGSATPLAVRDGDVLDVALQDATALSFDTEVTLRTSWPLDPPGSFPIDGMTADQVTVDTVGPANLLGGSRDNLALAVLLPANGYEGDVLERLGVVNLGSARPGVEIQQVTAWVDDGDGAFGAASDRSLGALSFTGNRWELTGLAESVPLGGLRVFFTVDLGALAAEGLTVRLGLPPTPDPGVGMASGNSGPLDRAVENPFDRTVSTADRVTLTAAVLDSVVVQPGGRDVLLLHVTATNSYSTTRTLTGVTFANATTGPGGVAELDREIRALTLRTDGDGNGALTDLAADSSLGTSFFDTGRAAFTGLDWALAPGESRHLFLTADVSLLEAADGDVLSARASGDFDFEFAEPTTVVASWPLDSRARRTVDGMVLAQVTNLGAPVATLGPGDGPALALDLILPRNGYANDVLHGLRVVNLGSAGSADLAELRLWRDGGDGVFSAGSGDDADVGPLVSVGGAWQSPLLSQPLSAGGARFFLSLTVSSSPADSATVRLAVPLGGVENASGNDGPLDQAIENPQTLLVSTSPLLATLETATAASTVGGQMQVRMLVRNVGSETLNGVAPSALAVSGSAGLLPAGGPLPPSFDLAPAATDTFLWTFDATGAGDARFSANAEGTGAMSGLRRRSLSATSNLHRVFLPVADLDMFPVQSMPFTVSRGQTDVVPFSLTFSNQGGAGASDVRLRRLRVRLEDDAGAGVVPSQLLSRVAVNEGTNVYLVKTAVETTGAEIDLALASPVLITGLEPVTLSLRLDIASGTTVPSFRAIVVDSSSFAAEDATSGAPVTVKVQGGSYPVRSDVARLVVQATRLDVAGVASTLRRVGPAALDVPLLRLRLENPGLSGLTSDVRVGSFGVTLSDTNGVPIARPSDYLKQIRVRSPLQTLADRPLGPTDGPNLTLSLAPPLGVPVNTPLELLVLADVADSPSLGAIQVRLQDSLYFDARDANTRAALPVIYAAPPIAGAPVVVEATAETLLVSGTPALPAAVGVGAANLDAMRIVVRHPGPTAVARIRLDSLTVSCRNQSRSPLIPGTYLARLRLLWNSGEVANLTNPPTGGGSWTVPLPGLLVSPGDSAVARIVVDLSATAPSGFLELAVAGSGIPAADANSGLPVKVEPEAGTDLPLTSGLALLQSPARDLEAGLTSRMPAAVAADGREVEAGRLTLTNLAAPGSGPVSVDHLVLRSADRNYATLAVGSVAARLAAYVGGSPWAQSATLTADSTTAFLAASGPIAVAPGAPVEVELRVVPRAGSGAPGFRLGCDAAGIGVVQPGSALLAVTVRPRPGQAFPLWTEAASFSAASLRESYANFPNPFAAGREPTAFAYYMPLSGRVTLRIWTARGEQVATVAENQPRSAGLNQSDLWDGRNGAGNVVRNGVYVAELVARFDDGSSERVLRKVAVVR